MEREIVEGPPTDIFKKKAAQGEENEEDLHRPLLASEKAEDFDEEKLRKYQLERLRSELIFYVVETTEEYSWMKFNI